MHHFAFNIFPPKGRHIEMRSNIKTVKMTLFVLLAICLALGAAQITGASEVLYKSNAPLKLQCNIASELGKNVKYEWQKDGKPLPSSYKGVLNERDGSLQFQSPDANIEGVYQCLAKSELGVAGSEMISVKRTYINFPEIIKKKHIPVRGHPLALECPQVDAYPKAGIAWMRQEKDEPMKHYLTVRTTVGPNNFLYFANVTDEDASKDVKYICATLHIDGVPVYNHTGEEKAVILAEHVIPELKSGAELDKAVEQYVSKTTVAKEGENTFLYCIFGGAIIPPDYFYDGKNVNGDENPGDQRITRHNRSKGRRLLIKETRLSDQGTYTCKITDSDGSTKTSNMNLFVVSAPSFAKQAQPKTAAKEGQDVIIPCQVKGVPAPKVTWTYNAQPLSANDRISFSASEASGVVTSDLKIKGVQKQDAGYYGCKASNDNGNIYTETLLSVA